MGESLNRSNKIWDEWVKACEALRAKPPRMIKQEELSQLHTRVNMAVLVKHQMMICHTDQEEINAYIDGMMDSLQQKINQIFSDYEEDEHAN